MGVKDMLARKKAQLDPNVASSAASSEGAVKEKGTAHDDSPMPFLTARTFFMGVLVSMGGIVFGYDTGQISGFLEMKDFLENFGQLQSDGTYAFTNVRSGLIVGMVCRTS